MRLVRYSPRSAVALSLLKEAVEFVRDFEGDMCVDLASELKSGNKRFDETLSDIVDMRRRVRFATNFIVSLESTKVGEDLHFDNEGLEVIDKGLEFMQDQLADEINEPLFAIEREIKTSGRDHITLTFADIVRVREAVDKNVERAEIGGELLREFRAIRRS